MKEPVTVEHQNVGPEDESAHQRPLEPELECTVLSCLPVDHRMAHVLLNLASADILSGMCSARDRHRWR